MPEPSDSSRTQRRLKAILAAHPELTSDGYTCGHDTPVRGCQNLACGDWVKTGRAAATLRLPRAAETIAAVVELLKPYSPTGRVSQRSPNSYQLKHVAERCLTDHAIVRGYVPNGEFIAAALFAGFKVEPCGHGSPNALIGMRQADVRDLEATAGRIEQQMRDGEVRQ